jgi:hypothetical protein
MARPHPLLLFVPPVTLALCLGLSGCYSDQKKQLAACEASATRTGGGQPLRSIQACMDQAGYSFVGYARADGPTVDCDLPAVIRGTASPDGTDAMCFQPKGALALRIYHIEVPVKNAS